MLNWRQDLCLFSEALEPMLCEIFLVENLYQSCIYFDSISTREGNVEAVVYSREGPPPQNPVHLHAYLLLNINIHNNIIE